MRRRTVLIAAILLSCLLTSQIANAQQTGKVFRIGYLAASNAKAYKPRTDALKQELDALGYVVGQNIRIEERYALGDVARLPALARELVALKVDVMVIHGTSAVSAANKVVAGQIPIVFAVVADPVGAGFVKSLSRPGGNITGVSDFHSHLVPKRLELLKELLPKAKRFAVFWHRKALHTVRQLDKLKKAARSLGVMLVPVEFGNISDLRRAEAIFRESPPDALNVLGYSLIAAHRRQLAEFSQRHGLPSISTTERSAEAGFLMTYGVSMADLNRRAAHYVDKILRGARPSSLPVELPTRFYLTINMKTAKALGVTIPQSILLRADRVIE